MRKHRTRNLEIPGLRFVRRETFPSSISCRRRRRAANRIAGCEATSWQGLAAPKATPAEIVERLSEEASAAIADATLKSRIENLGYATCPMGTAELTRFIADETEKWAKVIRAANIKAN
jgi:hypothetical protein